MRIIDRKEFLECPSGTVYGEYFPWSVEGLRVKQDNCGDDDWFYIDLIAGVDYVGDWSSNADHGDSFPLSFNGICRDGAFDDDQLFAIYEPADVAGLIEALEKTRR